MAFAQGKESGQNTGSFKRYVGLASVKVLAINPTMDEWNKITGGNLQKEPEYTSTKEDGTKQAKLVLLVQPDKEKTVDNVEPIIPVTFWFSKTPVQGSQSGKYKVIDKYGRTAWATKEDIEAKRIPEYSNGPASIDADYRRLVTGEEALTNFLKAHLAIPALSYKDKNGNVVINPNPSECEARLDNIMKVFDGDFKEIKTILGYKKDNYSKMLFGVKTTDDGKEYQDVFMELFLNNKNSKDLLFAKELKGVQDSGRTAYNNTYFGELNPNGELIVQPLRERVVAPTEFTESATTMPAAAGTSSNKDDLPF